MDISKNESALAKARKEYEIARSFIDQGKRTEAAKHAVKAYNILYF
jgi:hypothetical protein